MTKIKVLIGTTLVIALAALQIGQSQLQEPVVAANDDNDVRAIWAITLSIAWCIFWTTCLL